MFVDDENIRMSGKVKSLLLLDRHTCNSVTVGHPQIATPRHHFGIDYFKPRSPVVIPIKQFE